MKKTNYGPALEKGRGELRSVWEKAEMRKRMAEVCGCTVKPDSLVIPYFSLPYTISMPECTFSGNDLGVHEKILLLHYISRPFLDGSIVSGNPESWITFKQLPSAEFYNSTYRKRGPGIILSSFASRPDTLTAAGAALGGKKGTYGDASVLLNPLPKINAMTVLYAGDDELPAEAEILFSGDIHRFLPLEDTAVLAGLTAVRLVKAAAGAREK